LQEQHLQGTETPLGSPAQQVLSAPALQDYCCAALLLSSLLPRHQPLLLLQAVLWHPLLQVLLPPRLGTPTGLRCPQLLRLLLKCCRLVACCCLCPLQIHSANRQTTDMHGESE
jgi:hypothetical protein